MKFKNEEEYEAYHDYMKELCEECTKTQNHCCSMDIPLDMPNAMHLLYQGDKVGITNTILRQHPEFDDKVFICTPETKGNITLQECVFFKDGKCAIYEYRPVICRYYGTEFMKCRNTLVDSIPTHRMDTNTMNKFDDIALNKSDVNKYIKRVKI